MSDRSIVEEAFTYALQRNKGATYSDSETAFREFLEWYLGALPQPSTDEAALLEAKKAYCRVYYGGDEYDSGYEAIMGDAVEAAIKAYLAAKPRPSADLVPDERDTILRLFWGAQVAFDHGDDVAHMLEFGEAYERLKAWVQKEWSYGK